MAAFRLTTSLNGFGCNVYVYIDSILIVNNCSQCSLLHLRGAVQGYIFMSQFLRSFNTFNIQPIKNSIEIERERERGNFIIFFTKLMLFDKMKQTA